MTYVWLVMNDDYLIGVFDTRELAESAAHHPYQPGVITPLKLNALYALLESDRAKVEAPPDEDKRDPLERPAPAIRRIAGSISDWAQGALDVSDSFARPLDAKLGVVAFDRDIEKGIYYLRVFDHAGNTEDQCVMRIGANSTTIVERIHDLIDAL